MGCIVTNADEGFSQDDREYADDMLGGYLEQGAGGRMRAVPFVSDQERGTRFPDAGAMHEPKPYTGELDWPDHDQQYDHELD